MTSSASAPADAWVQVRLPGRDAKSARVELQFSPAFVRSVLQGSGRSTRGISISPDLETMLMEDTIELGDKTIYVAVWLEASFEDAQRYRLRVDVDAPGSIQRDVFVTLHWNGILHEVELPKKTVRVTNKSRRRFSKWFAELPSSEFRLTFEYKHGSKN